MSRLIVKNLPKKTTVEDLRQLFSQKGTITDLQLKSTPEGKFRHFAFVGYQTEKQAEEAIQHFDKICIGTNRLTVELCKPLDASDKTKSIKKYHEEKPPVETKAAKKKSKKKVNLLEKYSSDPQFKEFMDKNKITNNVENEDDEENSTVHETSEEENSSEEKVANFNISDSEYKKNLMKKTNEETETHNVNKERKSERKYELFTVKLKGLPYACKKKDVKKFLSPLVPFTIRLPPKIKGIAYVGFKEEKNMNKALLKNKSFLDGKRIFVMKSIGKDDNDNESNETKKYSKWKQQEEMLANEESIAESGKIFVRNLSYTVTQDDIEQLFVKYGPLADIDFKIDQFTKKPKGFATVTYVMPEDAFRAFTELDGTCFQGRMLHLLPGKAKNEDSDITQGVANYKKKKQAENKKQASSSHNWNALFLGHNAVAEVLASSRGVSKEDILSPHGDDNAAVRLALGETQIVAETRKFLEKHGVVLDAFTTPNAERSNTIILVKGLPHKTEPEEIRKVFQDCGVIGRVILPPSGITAIVEFIEPSEAKKAFLKVAYKRFKNVPLFLEWAPKNSLQACELKKEETAVQDKEKVEEEEQEDEEPEEGARLFVKNLNFETTDESLRKHFEPYGKLKYATVKRKINRTNPQLQLSMGYGFVQYIHKESADAALKDLQQSTLDGKSLELKRSDSTTTNEIKSSRKVAKKTKQTGTKIFVGNIPFQATRKELLDLFKVFGEIKALRMPQKPSVDSTHSCRGFAFVDFCTENDAKAAFDALCQSTHLYGRRLILEWAAAEENVEQIRKRTADHFRSEETVSSKKSVINI